MKSNVIHDIKRLKLEYLKMLIFILFTVSIACRLKTCQRVLGKCEIIIRENLRGSKLCRRLKKCCTNYISDTRSLWPTVEENIQAPSYTKAQALLFGAITLGLLVVM